MRNADLHGQIFSKKNFSRVDFRGANLHGAYFTDTDFSGATMFSINFVGATVYNSSFANARLTAANLSGGVFGDTNFFRADFTGANLSGAKLSACNFTQANFHHADLTGANLRGSIFTSANFRKAILRGVIVDCETANFLPACPAEGSFTAYKKAGGKIIVLEIPADAKRSSATTPTCRADKAKVLRIENLDGSPAEVSEIPSDFDESFIYRVGETVEVKNFCDDRWVECGAGIHFYIARELCK